MVAQLSFFVTHMFRMLSLSLLLVALTACANSRLATYPASIESLPPDRRVNVQWFQTEEGVLSIDASDPQIGPQNARCTLVVFSDFLCPFCQEAAQTLTQLQREFQHQIRIVFKFLPLGMHAEARPAAVAAYLVFLESGSAAFWKFHDRLFSNPHAISNAALIQWLQEIGISAHTLQNRQTEIERHIKEDIAQAQRLAIEGTPHMYINQRTVRSALPYATLKKWIQKELRD